MWQRACEPGNRALNIARTSEGSHARLLEIKAWLLENWREPWRHRRPHQDLLLQLRPALRTEELLQLCIVLRGTRGQSIERPNPLAAAVLVRDFDSEFRIDQPPLPTTLAVTFAAGRHRPSCVEETPQPNGAPPPAVRLALDHWPYPLTEGR